MSLYKLFEKDVSFFGPIFIECTLVFLEPKYFEDIDHFLQLCLTWTSDLFVNNVMLTLPWLHYTVKNSLLMGSFKMTSSISNTLIRISYISILLEPLHFIMLVIFVFIKTFALKKPTEISFSCFFLMKRHTEMHNP